MGQLAGGGETDKMRSQDSIYHMALKSQLIWDFKIASKRQDFAIRKRDDFMDVNA